MTHYLVEHYKKIGGLKKDFRNWNLFCLVAPLVKGESVADVGCGAAFFSGILKASGKKVIGFEPSEEMRLLARQMNPSVNILPGRAEEIDSLLPEPVDSVVMIDVLEHIKEDFEQIKKVRAVLNNGGEFVFVVPAHPFLYGKRDEQMGHYRRYSKNQWKKYLSLTVSLFKDYVTGTQLVFFLILFLKKFYINLYSLV